MPLWESIALTAIPYVVPALIAVFWYVAKRLAEKLPVAQREEAARIVQVAVTAAEQSMPGATGEDKKAAVVSDLESIFKQSHLKVPPELVNALIESAVGAMNEGQPHSTGHSPVGFVPNVSVDG